jgi:hypothetical protein
MQRILESKPANTPIYSAGILETGNVHAFLTERYWSLAEPLAKVLRNMKREGLIDEYARHAVLAMQTGAQIN